MPGLTRHPLLCRVALGNSLLQWIPAFAGMVVGMDSCFRRNGSGSVRRNGGRCPRHHAGLDPASIIVSRCPGQLTAPMDSCFRRNGSGSVRRSGGRCPRHHAGLDPASIIVSRCPGQLTAPMDSCSNGFLLSQEWEWEWIPAFAGMGVGMDSAFAGMGVGVCAGMVAAALVTMPGLTRHPLLCRVALGNSLLQWIPAFAGMVVGMDSCFRRNGSGSGALSDD